jgi:hypothetical protein
MTVWRKIWGTTAAAGGNSMSESNEGVAGVVARELSGCDA